LQSGQAGELYKPTRLKSLSESIKKKYLLAIDVKVLERAKSDKRIVKSVLLNF
jgi:hypothetical protein